MPKTKILLSQYTNNSFMSSPLKKYRYEKKFVINNKYNYLINKYVKNNSLMFKKQFNKRSICSIYFDDDNLALYKQNVDGLSERKKIRIRWYPDGSNTVSPILEIKKKKGNIGEKLRYFLNPISEHFINNCPQKILNKILKNKFERKLNELMHLYRPTLLVRYEREYFLSNILDCRLTIDKNIKFYSINSNKINNLCRRYKNSIIELKYPVLLENQNMEGILEMPFRVSKHSKYIEGINIFH